MGATQTWLCQGPGLAPATPAVCSGPVLLHSFCPSGAWCFVCIQSQAAPCRVDLAPPTPPTRPVLQTAPASLGRENAPRARAIGLLPCVPSCRAPRTCLCVAAAPHAHSRFRFPSPELKDTSDRVCVHHVLHPATAVPCRTLRPLLRAQQGKVRVLPGDGTVAGSPAPSGSALWGPLDPVCRCSFRARGKAPVKVRGAQVHARGWWSHTLASEGGVSVSGGRGNRFSVSRFLSPAEGSQ